jgi:hypothetical protein
MSESGRKGQTTGQREKVSVTLPVELHAKLSEFCREKKVSPDLVVERALTEYFREGDVSH